MTLADLYRTYRVSAYRLETRQHYTVPGDQARQQAFHTGRPLPPPRPDKAQDLQLIAELRAAGRKIGRIHIVDLPLTPYLRYELAVYPENVTAGEDVRITLRTAHPDLAGLTEDFVIFDGGTDQATVAWFIHDPDGRVIGHEITDDPIVAGQCWRDYQFAAAWSVPLDQFTAPNLSR